MAQLDAKRILLVHPLGYDSERAKDDISRLANIMPPIGILSIAAWLEQHGYIVDIIDCYAHPDSDALIAESLNSNRPAWIGFSCTTSAFLDGVRQARMAKDILPEIRTLFGGVHVSSMKERSVDEFPDVDIAIMGEGEETMLELLEAGPDATADTLSRILGLVHRLPDGKGNDTGRRKGMDLDRLPFPAYEKLVGYPESYALPIFNYPQHPSTSCIASRGCPYSCSYCDRSVFGADYRSNSPEYIYNHMKHLKERFGIRHINFYDDQFTFQTKRVDDLCKLLIEKPLGMTFNCAVRANHVKEATLRLMKQAGCWMVSLGIETGDEDLLKQHRKKSELGDLADKIRVMSKIGLRVKGLLMIGLPGETEQTVKRTMEYVFSLPLDDMNLTKFTPFPGSPLYRDITAAKGALGEFDERWEKMDCMNIVFVPNGLTRDRMEELFSEFYKRHFTRPRVIWGYTSMLWRSPHSWIRFLSNLPSFLRFAFSDNRFKEDKS
jgi:radical SAM superfamily enzyme YgiQ (UPF0313 family)